MNSHPIEQQRFVPHVDRDVDAAARWLASALEGKDVRSIVVFIGAGNGHVLEALERRAPHAKVLVLEPDPARARACLVEGKWADRIASGRLAYLADPDYHGADEAWRVFPTKEEAPVIVVHPATAGAPGIGRAKEVLKRILFGVRANAQARRQFAPRYLLNSIRNIPAIVTGRDVRALTDAYKGLPAIVAGAGPSLDNAIPQLQELQGRALLIACDTALRPLLHAGIAPQLVVALDPSTANARHFLQLPECQDTWLVAESALDPAATSVFDGRTFWFRVANHHPWPWLNEQGIDVGTIDVWGSVLTGAFQVACLAGCDPVVFVGADLAYSRNRPYARGTTYELDWAYYAARGQTLSDTWRGHVLNNAVERVPDILGGSALSSKPLVAFRNWIAERVKRSGRRVINSTGAGILIGDGIEALQLPDALADVSASSSVSSVARNGPTLGGPDDLAARLSGIHDALLSPGPTAHPIGDWADFSGDGFNVQHVAESLDASVAVLESRAVRGSELVASRTPPIQELFRESPGYFARLPEALARLREGLNDAAPLTPPPAVNANTGRGVAIERAFALVAASCHAIIGEQSDAAPIDDAVRPLYLPVSGSYRFNDRIAWLTTTAEAVLGASWVKSPKRQERFSIPPPQLRDEPALAPFTADAARRHANRACALLALEWLRCAIDASIAPAMELWRLLYHAVHFHDDEEPAWRLDELRLQIEQVAGGQTVDVRVPIDERRLARVLTGAIRRDENEPYELPWCGHLGFRVRLAVRGQDDGRPEAPAIHVSDPHSFFRPRVLTDGALPRARANYSTGGNAVCTATGGTAVWLVGEDGSARRCREWPRPILAELPLGDGGAVAWGDGLSRPGQVDPGYVMWREGNCDDVHVQELPFRPITGTWWNGRIYWSCFPRPVETWVGLASWAPGEEGSFEVPGLEPILGFHATDLRLVLEPGRREEQGKWSRRLATQGWEWRPGADPVPVPLGPLGVVSSRASHAGWTAVAHPEADCVSLSATDGRRRSMRCYYPYHVTWLGDSLLVSTLDSELLWFQDLAVALDRSIG